MTPLDLGGGLMLATFALPLLLAALLRPRLLRPWALAAAPWATLPALVVALGLESWPPLESDWLILGARLGTSDALTRGFLLLTTCVWLTSGWYARDYVKSDPERARFWTFFLATFSGNVGLIVAEDVASFYAFYALMTFAAYGLIVHARTEPARRAGRVYLVMALLGEMLLLTAFLLIVGAGINLRLAEVPHAVAASSRPALVVALLWVGFGVKAGAFLLHVWLPLAHPVAPTPASAVLSGAMVKAGVLGWLRFLPLGIISLPALGTSCLVAGLIAAFYAAAVGVTQRDPKTILAYSTVSQMGLMTAALGVGLASQDAASVVVAAVLVFATHHAIVKAALFLGVGVAHTATSAWTARLVALGLLGSAASLAGAPLSSGALAKASLKHALALAPSGAALLTSLLSLAAVGSTLLMVQYLRRALPKGSGEARHPSAGLCAPWVLLLVLQLAFVWSPPSASEEMAHLLLPGELWASAWPLATGLGLAGLVWRVRHRAPRLPEIPAGDLLLLVERLLMQLRPTSSTAWRTVALRLRSSTVGMVPITRLSETLLRSAERAEVSLSAYPAVGLTFALLLVLLVALLLAAAR